MQLLSPVMCMGVELSTVTQGTYQEEWLYHLEEPTATKGFSAGGGPHVPSHDLGVLSLGLLDRIQRSGKLVACKCYMQINMCAYIYMCVYIYTCVCSCLCAYVYACLCVSMCVHACVDICVCACLCMYMCVFVHVCACVLCWGYIAYSTTTVLTFSSRRRKLCTLEKTKMASFVQFCFTWTINIWNLEK